MKNSTLKLITRTALFIALLIAVQYVTKPLGQFVTGSLVNLLLVTAALTTGLWSGLLTAAVSPVLAFFAGIGPVFPQLIPVVALGNVVIVAAFSLIYGKGRDAGAFRQAAAVVTGAVLKFLVLWIGIVKIALPVIPGIKPPQVAAMTATFSWPQLVTALIGGTLAMLIVPRLAKALTKSGAAG